MNLLKLNVFPCVLTDSSNFYYKIFNQLTHLVGVISGGSLAIEILNLLYRIGIKEHSNEDDYGKNSSLDGVV